MITQLNCSLKFFRPSLKAKYGFEEYCNPHEPAVFFGMYKRVYKTLYRHKALAVVVWSGSDSIGLWKQLEFVGFLKKNSKRIFHIAISDIVGNDLKKAGVDHIVLPVTPFNHNLEPVPLGDKIYTYAALSDDDLYGIEMVRDVEKHIDYEIIYVAPKQYSRKHLIDFIYPQCFLGLRLTKHDGLPNTVLELGAMGRKVVTNVDTPNALPYRDVKSIINHINSEAKKIGTMQKQVSKDVKDFILLPETWRMTETYTKNMGKIKKQKVSVVMNSYRENEQYFNQAVLSYLNQKGVEVELIVSTVQGDPCIEWSKKLGVHKIVVNKKPGIYQQLNNALKHMTGDWFAYASSNDVALETKLYNETNTCIANKAKVCYSSFYHTDESLKIVKTYKSKEYDYQKHLKGNFVNDCATVSMDILRKYAPFRTEHNNHAYHDFWLRIYQGEGNVFAVCKQPTWYYRVFEQSQHLRRKGEKAQKNRDDFHKLIDKHKKTNVPDESIKNTIQLNTAKVTHKTNHDFVWVYVAKTAVGREAWFSIRSVKKFFNQNPVCYTVGDRVGGAKNIQADTVTGVRFAKALDSINKLKIICKDKKISDDFVYMYDDIVFARDFGINHIGIIRANDHIGKWSEYFKNKPGEPDPKFKQLLYNTYKVLRQHKLPTFNYETHTPRIYNKERILQIIERFDLENTPLLFNTLYFNTFFKKPEAFIGDDKFKVGMYRPYHNMASMKRFIDGATIINYNDNAYCKEFEKILKEITK